MKYKIADLVVEFEPQYETLEKRAEKYLDLTDEPALFEIHVEEEAVQKLNAKRGFVDDESSEYMLMGSRFYRKLLDYQGCLLHSSAVVMDDEAYLFSADSGTGKSTHTSLWLKYLADKKPYILNDDKPAIRILEDGIFAYGTPFSGKYDINENKKVKLRAICFIEQAKENVITRLEPKDVLPLFFPQTVKYLDEQEMGKFFDILEIIIKEIPFYRLKCNMSEEAVQLSYHTMKGEVTDEN